MTQKPRVKADPLEQEIEQALNPGVFIADRACFSFVSDLDDIAAGIAKLADTDPTRAVALHETFLAGCYEKAEELDDSSGSFGQFVDELFCGWIKARQAGGADPDETAARLLGWMDDDPYGFCYHLERDAAKALDKTGLAAFVKQIRARFDGAAKAKSTADSSLKDRLESVLRRWGETLRTLYLAQKNLETYVAFAEETGLTAQDCHAVATLLVGRRKPEEALAWAERGIDLNKKTPRGSSAGYDLAGVKRQLLVKLGRGKEALDAAWADYRRHPSKYTYDDLLKYVPRAERPKWHAKAMEATEGADLHSLMELLLETKELKRLAGLVRRSKDPSLEGLSHFVTEPAARRLEKTDPDIAARLWRAQGMRIVQAKKSKYYEAALLNFERAKRCFERAGLVAAWEKTVSHVRADHHRKTGFMSRFEGLVAGISPGKTPSFLERAKARWTDDSGETADEEDGQ